MKVGKVYSLVWDHFTSNISTFVKDNLLENNGLSDVTLVSDDNNKFHAHKTVLSAGSQIFNDIFELNNTSNNGEPQTIIVGGVRGAELDHLLRFLYTGEVLLQKDAAITFTEIGKYFQLKNEDYLQEFMQNENNIDNNLFDADTSIDLRHKDYESDIKEYDSENSNMQQDTELNIEEDIKLHVDNDFASDSDNDVWKGESPLALDSNCMTVMCKLCQFQLRITLQNSRDKEITLHIMDSHFSEDKKRCSICDTSIRINEKKTSSTSTRSIVTRYRTHMKHNHNIKFCGYCDCEYEATEDAELKHTDPSHINIDASKLQCKICPFQSKSQSKLFRHNAVRHESRIYFCNVCHYATEKVNRLREHVRAKHGSETFDCTKCNYKGTTKPNLKDHVRSRHEGIKFKCPHCDTTRTKQTLLNMHIKVDHKGLRYTCDHCDFETKAGEFRIREHVKAEHENFRVYCNLCKYKAKTNRELKRHIQGIHTKKKEYRFY